MTKPLRKIIIASHNQGKIREISALFSPLNIETVSAADLGLDDVEETGSSFIENAELKAIFAAKSSDLPALSDDSGLAVDALGGAPGIYSARWCEDETGQRDWLLGMARVREAIEKSGLPMKSARFVCALTLAFPDGRVQSFEGKVEGEIVWPPRGDKGFGYDPIFKPHGYDISFGQMPPDEKHAISHRADAFAQLLSWLETQQVLDN